MNTAKSPVKAFIIPEAISSIRDAVEKTRGNEVFFVGRLKDDHLVAEVDVYAMGNKHAVPAIIKEAKYGDVIIHNHPDGVLEPSDADLEIASYIGSQGVGCYIVDNNVEYLYPVVKVPKKRTYEGVVVSTHTINLQEQLIEKDIPVLKKCCGINFKSVLVKGRNNYICLRKVYNLRSEGGTLIEDKDRKQLNDLLEWAVKTRDGSKADLNFVPQDDVWEAIQSEADQCTRLKCRFYDDCF